MSKKKIALIGAGGFGREVFAFIERDKFEVMGFVDKIDPRTADVDILGDDDILSKLNSMNINHVCIAIGDMNTRSKIYKECQELGLVIPNIIHRSASIFSDLKTGLGIFIYPNVVITSGCRIGSGCLINSGVTIGHDVTIGEFSNISPGVNLAGNIKIGSQTLIGIGASIRENVEIGNRVVIGAGSVVVSNIPNDSLAYGVPAKIITNLNNNND